MNSSPHLWLALSPHGYGHAVMTAPLVNELRRRRPGLRLTIQTALPRAFLETRYLGPFEHVPRIHDFGMRMTSSVGVDLEASAADYAGLHARWDQAVAEEAGQLAAARPDLVLANIPYVTLAAAARAGVRSVAFSSLNWADIYRHYLGDHPEAPAIEAQMRAAYHGAETFLRVTPSMDMTLVNLVDVGPVARVPADRSAELKARLGLAPETRVGVVAFGGIDHPLDLAAWPSLPGWFWLTNQRPPQRPDMAYWEAAGVPFVDLVGSVAVVVTKPGYGTFTEAAMAGTAVLYVPRPDWPECPNLDNWLANHTRSCTVEAAGLFDGRLEGQLHRLFMLEKPPVASPTGVAEAADSVLAVLDRAQGACERS